MWRAPFQEGDALVFIRFIGAGQRRVVDRSLYVFPTQPVFRRHWDQSDGPADKGLHQPPQVRALQISSRRLALCSSLLCMAVLCGAFLCRVENGYIATPV